MEQSSELLVYPRISASLPNFLPDQSRHSTIRPAHVYYVVKSVALTDSYLSVGGNSMRAVCISTSAHYFSQKVSTL